MSQPLRALSNTVTDLHLRLAEGLAAPFSVNRVVELALWMIGAQARSHGVELVLQLADGVPDVRGMATEVEQVILNLLRNAGDAVLEGEGQEAGRSGPVYLIRDGA